MQDLAGGVERNRCVVLDVKKRTTPSPSPFFRAETAPAAGSSVAAMLAGRNGVTVVCQLTIQSCVYTTNQHLDRIMFFSVTSSTAILRLFPSSDSSFRDSSPFAQHKYGTGMMRLTQVNPGLSPLSSFVCARSQGSYSKKSKPGQINI